MSQWLQDRVAGKWCHNLVSVLYLVTEKFHTFKKVISRVEIAIVKCTGFDVLICTEVMHVRFLRTIENILSEYMHRHIAKCQILMHTTFYEQRMHTKP